MGIKELSLDERRYEALRLRAKALRISEDELVRRAIDAVLVEPLSAPPLPDHLQAAAEFLEATRALAESRVGAEPSHDGTVGGAKPSEPYRFSRDELYEEREARWTPPR
jgi:hypothetical protein